MRTERSRRWARPGVELAVGLGIMGVLVLVAVAAPPLLSERADELLEPSAGASSEHWLGTDASGHDMLARTLVATRLSLLMAAGATGLAVLIGVSVGALAWLLPSRVRAAVLWLINTMVAFPALLLALVVAAIMGPGARSVVIALGVAAAPSMARLTANLGAQIAQRDHVVVARGLGVPRRRLLGAHLLPNMAEPLLIVTASQFAQSLISISALSFVGLGVQSPDYDYGKLLDAALPGVFAGDLVQLVGPAVMIVLTGLAGMLIGDGLAGRADPRLRAGAASAARVGAPAPRPTDATPGPVVGDVADVTDAAADGLLLDVRDLRISTSSGLELVHGVDLALRRGEIVGIVGESGSGKSLTASAIAQLLPDGVRMDADRLRLADLDLTRPADPRRLVDELAMIYQDPSSTFNPALKVGRQMTELFRVHRGMSRRAARDRLVSGLEAVQIRDPRLRLRQYPRELSGGMRQRVMIAQALASGAQLLIADEPTTALDVTVQADVLRQLARANAESQLSILLISHDLGVVRALCHRVLVMQAGTVVEELSAAALTADQVQHPYTRQLLAATPVLGSVHANVRSNA